MPEQTNQPSGSIGSGSMLLLAEKSLAIADGAEWTSDPIDTKIAGRLGIDIEADHACTLEIVRIPDEDDPDTEGASSDSGSVTADTPAYFGYSEVLSPAVKIRITNSAGAALAGSLFVRGGAA